MPTFPSYHGPPLPEILNPLNPRHYLMLLDWVFFKPSRLKQYLYRADPELYFQTGLKPLAQVFWLPGYRNLIGMTLLLIVVLNAVNWIGSSSAQALLGANLGWARVAGGMVWGLVGIVVGSVVGGMAGTIALGIVLGMALGVAGSIAGSMALGTEDFALGIASGIVWGIAWGMVLGVTGGMAWGVTLGTVLGIAGGIVLGMTVGVRLGMAKDIARIAAWGLAGSMVLGLPISTGALRLPFYLLQVWPALWQSRRGPGAPARLARHPALWDELAVLPFPRLGRLLADTLVEDLDFGVQASRMLLRNSFQRWAVARAWARFLSTQPCPLVSLYRAFPHPVLDESPDEPLTKRDLRLRPSVRALWLGELGGTFVDPTAGGLEGIPDRLAWVVTRPLRGQPDPRVAPLARFLLHLVQDEERVLERGPDPDRLEEAVRAIAGLPHGEEVVRSLQALIRVGDVQGMEDIAQAGAEFDWLDHLHEEPLRPLVLEALRGLWDVAIEARRFQEATSPADQAAALNRATGMLAELEKFAEKIILPEQVLLRRAVRRWQEVIAKAAGQWGERALREMAPAARQALIGGERRATFWSRPVEPFPSPYQTGRPVEPPLFVGRQDILARIREIWIRKPNPDSVILYGHRRMGKTSILRNLGQVAPPGSLLVYADLKGLAAFAEGIHHLLQNLAQEITWVAQDRGLGIPDPSPSDYAAPSEAARSFRDLLRQVLAGLPAEGILILALDEFETVDVLVRDPQKPFGPELYDFLRDISFRNRVALVLAGLHTLDEMSRDYQHAFHESYVNIHVSYLAPEAAEQLITRPTPDFRLNYHPEVVRRIIELTHGQPLLIQRICTELVHHLNHELFDLEKDREARVLPEDLDAVLTDEFIGTETRYFEGIWNDQIQGREPERAVLGALAAGPMSEEALARVTGLSLEILQEALSYLQKRDLIGKNANGQWDLLVPLMRRWLRLNRKLWEVQDPSERIGGEQ